VSNDEGNNGIQAEIVVRRAKVVQVASDNGVISEKNRFVIKEDELGYCVGYRSVRIMRVSLYEPLLL